MKMLMCKFESFACQNGYYKLTSICQCKNTISSAYNPLTIQNHNQVSKVGVGGGKRYSWWGHCPPAHPPPLATALNHSNVSSAVPTLHNLPL